jgi:hypothetical protein
MEQSSESKTELLVSEILRLAKFASKNEQRRNPKGVKMSRKIFYIVAGLLALALCGCKSNSSNNGSIPSGGVSVPVTVTDYSGNKVHDATVVLAFGQDRRQRRIPSECNTM